MKRILLIACLALVVVGCGKSKAKKNIVGTWYETKIDGIDVPAGAQDRMVFEKIKSGEGDLQIIDAGGTSFDWKYNVADGGDKLELISTLGGFSAKTTVNVVSLDENEMVINWGTSSYVGTYNK